jgi:hypothetical protein
VKLKTTKKGYYVALLDSGLRLGLRKEASRRRERTMWFLSLHVVLLKKIEFLENQKVRMCKTFRRDG